MTPALCIRVEPLGSSDPGEVISQMADLVEGLAVLVVANLNGVYLAVPPGADVTEIFLEWQRLLNRK